MIGGNLEAVVQVKIPTVNEIGEAIKTWSNICTIKGFLDLSSGDSRYTYNTKLQESTHVFICDYKALDSDATANKSRLIISGKKYDILMIDNPMELNKQLEFYLRYVGV